MTVKEVKVQVSPREGGREVYSLTIPAKFRQAFSLRQGQTLKATAVVKRTGEFRLVYEGRVERGTKDTP